LHQDFDGNDFRRQQSRVKQETDIMTAKNSTTKNPDSWGLCVDCKWWQIEPAAKVEHLTAGLCIEEKLQPFKLRVTGNGGCNKFMEGKPAHGKGSSEKPPTAKPMR
jgi:hypothetical protein